MIIIKTNLNAQLTKYHNVGYTDLNSGYGIIFNGEIWEKKDIKTIMNELLASKRRDLLKIHDEIKEFLTTEDNSNINEVLDDIENIVMPKNEFHIKSKKNLVTDLKTRFYNNRKLIKKSIKKSGELTSNEPKNKTKDKTKNILRQGLTVENVDKILMERKQKKYSTTRTNY